MLFKVKDQQDICNIMEQEIKVCRIIKHKSTN